MKIFVQLFLFLNLILMTISCKFHKEQVDLIVFNAQIYTVDKEFSKATALAVKDGKFIAIGGDKKILSHYKSSNIIDAKNKPIFPGFMDGHCHFKGMGEITLRYADLTGCKSFEEVLERLQKYNEHHSSEWLLGRGWDQNLWESKAFPTNEKLTKLFPGKKVAITRIDGHAGLVSDNVLSLMGFNNKSKVFGGEIQKNRQEKLTGILLDKAYDMVKEIIPKLSTEEESAALLVAQQKCFELGLSGVTDAGLGINDILLIDSLQQQDVLKIKINAMMNPDETLDFFIENDILQKDRLSVSSVKLYADGALGSRGAKLIEPYSDAPNTSGLKVENNDYYLQICQKAYFAGIQVCTHAIGDGAVRDMLQTYGSILKDTNDLRWRIEHSQIVHPDDFTLFQKYSIIPSIQSTHATSDMFWAVERLGEERVKTAYAQKQLLQQNDWLINGTDFPIEHISPLYTFYAAVARKNLEGMPVSGFQIENALSREEALRSITIWPAKGYFEEKRKGSIEVGKEADFVMLSDDIMTIEEPKIPKTQVLKLFVSGEKVFEK